MDHGSKLVKKKKAKIKRCMCEQVDGQISFLAEHCV